MAFVAATLRNCVAVEDGVLPPVDTARGMTVFEGRDLLALVGRRSREARVARAVVVGPMARYSFDRFCLQTTDTCRVASVP